VRVPGIKGCTEIVTANPSTQLVARPHVRELARGETPALRLWPKLGRSCPLKAV
jgi:hypothetical protein